MTNTNTKSRRGVTIIELMVVFAIMGFLATVAVPNVFGVAEKKKTKMFVLFAACSNSQVDKMELLRRKYHPMKKTVSNGHGHVGITGGASQQDGWHVGAELGYSWAKQQQQQQEKNNRIHIGPHQSSSGIYKPCVAKEQEEEDNGHGHVGITGGMSQQGGWHVGAQAGYSWAKHQQQLVENKGGMGGMGGKCSSRGGCSSSSSKSGSSRGSGSRGGSRSSSSRGSVSAHGGYSQHGGFSGSVKGTGSCGRGCSLSGQAGYSQRGGFSGSVQGSRSFGSRGSVSAQAGYSQHGGYSGSVQGTGSFGSRGSISGQAGYSQHGGFSVGVQGTRSFGSAGSVSVGGQYSRGGGYSVGIHGTASFAKQQEEEKEEENKISQPHPRHPDCFGWGCRRHIRYVKNEGRTKFSRRKVGITSGSPYFPICRPRIDDFKPLTKQHKHI